MIYDQAFLYDIAVLGLRIVVAIIFFSSGKSHFQQPEERGKQIGMSKQATISLGIVEMLGAFSIALGIYIQIGGLLLAATMMGAIYKKLFVWNTGFYEDKGYGWHYDLLLLMAILTFVSYSGRLVLWP